MKQSAKTKRLARHHKRMAKSSKLSLVSLMDIFTILVFFLIVNSSNVEVLEADKSIKLPQSQSKTLAQENLVLLINDSHLLLQGKEIITLEALANDEITTIDGLTNELAYHKSRQTPSETGGRAITILGDQKLAYSVLKKILLTCSQAGFGDISLAVEQRAKASDGGGNDAS
ncbi:ExbD/TolR family protein [Psychrobium sp. nBUS_13]|uniref:ExbD/TolR family protein n=1 Tax=Psychrobium sp. nBUS_13 TaxID=3395319 RepID=UPI003EBE5FCC